MAIPNPALLILLLVTVAAVQGSDQVTTFSATQSSIDFFPELSDLTRFPPPSHPHLGGQNFTRCCLLALNSTLQPPVSPSGNWTLANTTSAQVLISSLPDLRAAQFPCGASYDGSASGAPVIQVSYAWLASTCPGWQRSSSSNLNAWLQPLSGYLLPAIVFCLSVPRRRKLEVPRWLFVESGIGLKTVVPALLGAVAALVVVCLDTVVWLATCFAFAGPMIVSGLYEAKLDNRILVFLKGKIENRRLSTDMRVRILMLVLIGNLDLGTGVPRVGPPVMGVVDESGENGKAKDEEKGGGEVVPVAESSEAASTPEPGMMLTRTLDTDHASPWKHMEDVLYELRLFDDADIIRNQSPRQLPRHLCSQNGCRNTSHQERPHPRTAEAERNIRSAKTRLMTMLHCQYSFGSVVGAPVIFFLGGFLFALLDSIQDLGDTDSGEGIAFGQWYMVIPHIAIVAGLLLAGNNPSILEGVLGKPHHPPPYEHGYLGFQPAYPSCYKVSWQSFRGKSKKTWLLQLVSTYYYATDWNYKGEIVVDEDMKQLREQTTLGFLDWVEIVSVTVLLVDTPFVLAFLTAYYTPIFGLSCRCLTFTVYAAASLGQTAVWLWAQSNSPRLDPVPTTASTTSRTHRLRRFLHRTGFFHPHSLGWIPDHVFTGWTPRALFHFFTSPSIRRVQFLWNILYYSLHIALSFVAISSAIGGTLMQLAGVYSTPMCFVTSDQWALPYERRHMVTISTNSADMIAAADTYWFPTSVAAIVFMAVVSFTGWWYQRRMRYMFMDLVDKFDDWEFAGEIDRSRRAPPVSPY